MYLNWVVRFISEVEISANAVHRVKIYCDEVKAHFDHNLKREEEGCHDILEESDDKGGAEVVEFRKSMHIKLVDVKYIYLWFLLQVLHYQ